MTPNGYRYALYPLIGVAAILAAWQFYVSAFGISSVVLPSPGAILSSSVANWKILLAETWPTFWESVLGFAAAVAIG
ncbi:MAG TPA: ABC transporter permease, partial [Xanthobacteraceae bacterium]